jgi:hypothetical protein
MAKDVRYGQEYNSTGKSINRNGMTAMNYAAFFGQLEILKSFTEEENAGM